MIGVTESADYVISEEKENMKASEMIEKWETGEDDGQRDTINVLKKYITRLHSKHPVVIHVPNEDRSIEGDRIQLENVYEYERTIAENITLIETPENETDQRNYLSVTLSQNPSLFYYCSFAYDGRINPRIISREVSELELPLDVEGKKVKANDIIFIFLDDEKSKIDNVLGGICRQTKMKDFLLANAPKILVLILIKSTSEK